MLDFPSDGREPFMDYAETVLEDEEGCFDLKRMKRYYLPEWARNKKSKCSDGSSEKSPYYPDGCWECDYSGLKYNMEWTCISKIAKDIPACGGWRGTAGRVKQDWTYGVR